MTTRTLKNMINGELVDSADGRTAPVINPSTEEHYADAPVSGAVDVDRAVKAAESAFETWRDSTPAERQLAMLKLADLMEQRADEFVAIESENTGKPLGFTKSEELPPAIDQVRFFAGAARVLEGRAAGEYMANHTSMIRREPIGVVAQVTPWNYPLMMASWKLAPAIAAGNTVVLKPSEQTPLTTLALGELLAGILPPGVVNIVCGRGPSVGAALVAQPEVRMASLTGSVASGEVRATSLRSRRYS